MAIDEKQIEREVARQINLAKQRGEISAVTKKSVIRRIIDSVVDFFTGGLIGWVISSLRSIFGV